MEIEVLSKFLVIDLWHYIRTRLLCLRMLLLLLFLLLLSRVPRPPSEITGWLLWDTLLMTTLLFQFRLWDDLADIEQDQRHSPDRILVKTEYRTHFRILTGVVAGLNALLILQLSTWISLVIFGLLTGGLWLWYHYPQRHTFPILSFHIVLLKYPIFIELISAQERPVSMNVSMTNRITVPALAYLALCLYEVSSDPSLRKYPHARFIAAVQTIIVVALVYRLI